ncbi:uncharacterized protein [Watersipora subatra]|uniref:uncharacterized protein n=1 Tax=Watersipora subatra TaxID=2589382 RepID=UPI00355C6228
MTSESLMTNKCSTNTDRALACVDMTASCAARTAQSTMKTSESTSSKTHRRAHRNNNAQLYNSPTGHENYTNDPHMAQYLQQMKAYQQALGNVMAQYPANQSPEQIAARGYTRENKNNQRMQTQVQRADNYQPMTGVDGVQAAYQQSIQRMRNVQAMMQHAYQPNQSQPYTNMQPGMQQDTPYYSGVVSPNAQAYAHTNYHS